MARSELVGFSIVARLSRSLSCSVGVPALLVSHGGNPHAKLTTDTHEVMGARGGRGLANGVGIELELHNYAHCGLLFGGFRF